MSKRRTPKNKQTAEILFPVEITPSGFVGIARNFDQDVIPEIIAALDLMCEDWGISEKVVNHFLAIKAEAESDDVLRAETRFRPKKIETKLHYTF